MSQSENDLFEPEILPSLLENRQIWTLSPIPKSQKCLLGIATISVIMIWIVIADHNFSNDRDRDHFLLPLLSNALVNTYFSPE